MRKLAAWCLLALGLAAVVAWWYWNVAHHPMGNMLAGDTASRRLAWGRLAGLLAALALVVQLILIGRVRWLEPAYGLDRLTRVHHVNGLLVPLLLLAHVGLIVSAYSRQFSTPVLAELKDLLLHWDDVAAAAAAFLLALGVVGLSLQRVRRRLRYETWFYVHLLTYAVLFLSVGHQLAVGGDFADHPAATAAWWGLYAFGVGNLVLFLVARPLFLFARHRFTVQRVEPETDDVTSVYITGRRLDRFKVEAGQFLILRFLAPGFRFEAHPFSLSCTPNGEFLRVSIKHVGDFTARVPSLPAGTRVVIDGAHGAFTARRCRADKALLLAGGIGITPLRSLSATLAAAGKDVVLIHGVRRRKDIVFAAELEAIARAGRLAVHHVLSSEPEWTGRKGYVDLACIRDCAPDFLEREVYLCGPPPMMAGLIATLAAAGVRRGRLHYERFAL